MISYVRYRADSYEIGAYSSALIERIGIFA